MKPILSRNINGPAIANSLEGNQTGLDLSGFGIEVVRPGDTGYFTIYIRLETSDEENVRFDLVKHFGIFLDTASVYTGDYDAETDLEDLLNLGDQGYGLSLKNPLTGDYDLIFANDSFDSEDGRYIIKKEHLFWYNTEIDTENPTLIFSKGFTTTVNASSSGTTLIASSSVFEPYMVGGKIFNSTENDWAVIEEYVNATTVKVSKSVNWDNDTIYMLQLESPLDGAIGFNQAAEDFGNMVKLDFKFSLPTEYGKEKIKQIPLKLSWYKIPNP